MLSEAMQNYLKGIYKLQKSHSTARAAVSTSLLAERMGVAAASATSMIKKLAEMRLLEHRPYQGVELTATGEKVALEIIRHHRLLELYLSAALGYAWDEVHAEAERLEHAISEDFEDRIDQVLGYPTVGAHGEPIPSKEGEIATPGYPRLSELGIGRLAVVRQVSAHNPEVLRYIENAGLRLGTQVEVKARVPFSGPLLLEVGASGEQHLGVELAHQIFVDPVET